MASTVTIDRIKERRSGVAGYRPGMNGSRPLDAGEPFVNRADKVRCIGNGDGTFIEYPIISEAERAAPGNPVGNALTALLGNVKFFGAKGDGISNDKAAFDAAAASGYEVVVPAGTYNVGLWTVPPGVKVRGAGKPSTFIRPLTRCTWAVRLLQSSELSGLTVNGNLVADRCVSVAGPYAQITEVHAQFAKVYGDSYGSGAGFFNEPTSVTFNFNQTSTDSNQFGIFSAGGFNNGSLNQHFSRGADVYGVFLTYSGNPDLDQPQAVRLSSCTFISNQFGIWCDKNIFGLSIQNTVVDLVGVTGIHVAEDSANVKIGPGNFLGGGPTGFAIDIGAGCTDVEIFSNEGVGNAYYAINVRATATKRCRSVRIHNNALGPAANAVVMLDSPEDCWTVRDNLFSGFVASSTSYQVSTQQTYSTASELGTVKVERNNFPNTNNPVIPFRTRCRENTGFKTAATFSFVMPQGATSVVVPHGLSVTPVDASARFPGALGQVYVDTFTSTSVTVHCTSGPPGAYPGFLDVRAD
jgi:hypothetical protein